MICLILQQFKRKNCAIDQSRFQYKSERKRKKKKKTCLQKLIIHEVYFSTGLAKIIIISYVNPFPLEKKYLTCNMIALSCHQGLLQPSLLSQKPNRLAKIT